MLKCLVAVVLALALLAGCGSSGGGGGGSPGTELVLQPTTPLTKEELERSAAIIEARLHRLGQKSVDVRVDSSQLVVPLETSDEARAVETVVTAPGRLDFYDLEEALAAPSIDAALNPVAFPSAYALLARLQPGQTGTPSQYWLFDRGTKKVLAGPEPTLRALGRVMTAKRLAPAAGVMFTTPHDRVVVTCSADTAVVCPGLDQMPPPGKVYAYLFKRDPAMTGSDLLRDDTGDDVDPFGSAVVTMEFTRKGNTVFHELTRKEAIRGRGLGIPQHFAIVLDDQLRSFPQLDYVQYPDGIDPAGGGAQITGLSSKEEAKRLAVLLATGTLPGDFVVRSRNVVR